jgi:aspartyl-tRNA synthetase
MKLKRTHLCGELRIEHVGEEVTLMGWVETRRDHGGLVFIDLRDRSGVVQVVLNPKVDEVSHSQSHKVRGEFVIGVRGVVKARPKGTANPALMTGEIEVVANELEILNPSKPLPFNITDELDASEELRMKYRYLDLRRLKMQRNLYIRHKVCQRIREFLDKNGFLEVETPILIRSTPEGARDYLIPSRLNPGKFYALPQSPQLFKQLLMIGGLDRYFQIAKCFRDEDLRADRQPEFTQLDIELSFVEEDDIYSLIERLMHYLFKSVMDVELKTPFPRLSYEASLERYGTDKPDVRFGLEIKDVTSEVEEGCEFKVFSEAISKGGRVKGINIPGCNFTRAEIEELNSLITFFGASGLTYFRVEGEKLTSPISKFFKEETLQGVRCKLGAKNGDFLVLVSGDGGVVAESLGNLRVHLASRLGIIKEGFHFLWIVDPPLLEYKEDEGRYVAMHHPFTSPKDEDLRYLEQAPERIKAKAYDLILNGVEIGGGSIRIHRREIQEKVFDVLKIGRLEAKQKFGFLLQALEYGAPPHGGIAIGLDRLLRVMLGCESIRDVIAFPKTQSGACLLTSAPFEVDDGQLKELHIKILEE